MIQVEGLLEDVDFRARVTREQLEELCSDLLERVEGTVEQALHAADITMVRVLPAFCSTVEGATKLKFAPFCSPRDVLLPGIIFSEVKIFRFWPKTMDYNKAF